MSDSTTNRRIIEAVLFAHGQAVSAKELQAYLPEGTKLEPLLEEIQTRFADTGLALAEMENSKSEKLYAFRTAEDLAPFLQRTETKRKVLSKAGLEVLAIIAYHQPITRAEIEELRGVSLGQTTLEKLLELGWVEMAGRREVAGRPLEYITSNAFLSQFSLQNLKDLPAGEELRDTGFLATRFGQDDDILSHKEQVGASQKEEIPPLEKETGEQQ